VFKRIIIIGVIILFPIVGYTQVVPPPVPPPPPPGLPIDGITGVLFLIGLIYGSKKILKDSSS
jgi:hypothetical protein